MHHLTARVTLAISNTHLTFDFSSLLVHDLEYAKPATSHKHSDEYKNEVCAYVANTCVQIYVH